MNNHFSHQDRVCLEWFKHFTASWPFHYLIKSTIDGYTWLGLEFIVYSCHCSLTFELRLVTILVPHPYFSHQDPVCLFQFKHLTTAWLFQCLITSILNDYTRLRLEFIVYDGRNNLFLSHEWGQMWWLDQQPLFTPRQIVFGMIQAFHSILTLPISH